MNIEDVKRAASINNIIEESKALHNKISKQSEQIIKLKIAQDVVYCNLKEKLNMEVKLKEELKNQLVISESKCENLLLKYHDEISKRQEVLNRVQCTREIAEVLEIYSQRLTEILDQTPVNHTAMNEMFIKFNRKLEIIQNNNDQQVEKFSTEISHLEEELKTCNEHNMRITQMYSIAKDQYDEEIQGVRAQLDEALKCKYELMAKINELSFGIEQVKKECEEKQNVISMIRKEGQQLFKECSDKMIELNSKNNYSAEKLKETNETIESLEQALKKQEEYTKTLQQHNNEMNEKLSLYEEEQALAKNNYENLKRMLEDAETKCEEKQETIAILNEQKDKVEKETAVFKFEAEENFKEKDAMIANLTQCTAELKIEISNNKAELADKEKDIQSQLEQINGLKAQLETMSLENQKLVLNLEEKYEQAEQTSRNTLEECMKKQREKYEQLLQLQNSVLNHKDEQLIALNDEIQQTSTELQKVNHLKTELEAADAKFKAEIEKERALCEKQAKFANDKINVLENTLKDNDGELQLLRKINLKLSAYKEAMQAKIDKASKNNTANYSSNRKRPNEPIPAEDDDSSHSFSFGPRKNLTVEGREPKFFKSKRFARKL